MRKAQPFIRVLIALIAIVVISPAASAQFLTMPGWFPKLDPLLQKRASLTTGQSRVIVRATDTTPLSSVAAIIERAGGTVGRTLTIINSQAADISNASLATLAGSPLVQRIALDRVLAGAMERTASTVGATAVRQRFGYDGSGVGVAIIDSGVTAWHDDLADAFGLKQRVDRFVDLVNGREAAYDDYGHGTHVAGIIAGNGFDSDRRRSGIAPAAHVIALKVLDGSGRGRISDVIAALDYVVAHRYDFNIRVVNLSVATGVYESYNLDPLTLAAQSAVKAGIVVVAAAGNNGRSRQGRTQYAGITAPGNAPWVLTVGASSHMGTVDRADDTIARFSSRGPSAIDYTAKPDLVAPGVGIESLSDPNSAFYTLKSQYLLRGTAATSYLPYLSLSGTSMATPVVSGTVALMLQANPTLTPNAVKAILEYTSQVYPYDRLTQGAGFLNAKGAVELARYLASPAITVYPWSLDWSAQLIWGNYLVHGGRPAADANAWSTNVMWGAATTPIGENVEWGLVCSTATCDAVGGPWSWLGEIGRSRNVVWGSTCGGANCAGQWTTSIGRSAVVGASASDTVVWGTSDADTVVWGTSGDDGDTVVWGTSCSDPDCEPVIWKNH